MGRAWTQVTTPAVAPDAPAPARAPARHTPPAFEAPADPGAEIDEAQ